MGIQWQPNTKDVQDEINALNDWLKPIPQEQTQWQPQNQVSTMPQTTQPYELPKQWAESAMDVVGEGISKVPILPKILEPINKYVFEPVQKYLEKPWASVITSPFSPNLPWEQGENWLAHEQREYEAWKAPTYVKGLAEFSMPLWWLPWFGWAGKGAKALGVGNKMTRALEYVSKSKAMNILPEDKVIDDLLFKEDFFKKVALWSENKPVLNTAVRMIGGPSAFVKPFVEGEAPIETVRRALIKKAVISDMRNGVRGLQVPKLQAISDKPVKLLDIADDGLIRGVTVKDGTSAYLSDVIEGYVKNPDNYKFTDPLAKKYVQQTVDIINDITAMATKEGVKVPKSFTFHRMVKGIIPEADDFKNFEASEWGSRFEMARQLKTMKEGATRATRRVIYDNNPVNSINATIDHYIKAIATKRFDNEVRQLGQTALGKFATKFPDEATRITGLTARRTAASYISNSIDGIFAKTPGWGSKLAKIRRDVMPESENIANAIEQAFSFTPMETDRVIAKLGKELWQATKVKPKEFKILLSQYHKSQGKILMSELDDAIHSLNVDTKVAANAIENVYKESYRTLTAVQKDMFKTIKGQVDDILKTTNDELTPLLKTRKEFLKPYRQGKQILGEREKVFTSHPAFKNLIFPREVVELAEPALKDAGNQWVRDMGNISGVGRTLVAAMDFSAPFIQGLGVLGRNPLAWAKAVGKQFEFFANPESLYKYMANPATLAVRTERIAFGGSTGTFEFYEALSNLQKGLGKVPKVGEIAQKAIGQTYGRAEAAFTGFSEVARNEMWKALRGKAVVNGQIDNAIARDLARSIDRMTGVMSMEALGIPRSQRDFENAFVFFAPRYTRAALSLVSDAFKGGVTGAEARKSIGSLMASGVAMYYGTCKALGQQPNLDINSAQFMTVKIGDSHVGIGGILYGLGRFGANVIGTAANEPLDLIAFNRQDNPFLKFMFQRTSPLTGTFVNIIEQKNYFGEPFESPADWGRFMAEKITPIALQEQLLTPSKANLPVFISELMGGRTFPKSAWELQEQARDTVAQREYGMLYENLDIQQQRQIEDAPEVSMFQEEIDKSTTRRGDALSVVFLERQRELDDARFMHKQTIEQLQKAYDDGMITGVEFKDEVQNANQGYSATYEHINQNPRYAEVLKKLQEPRDVARQYRWELAYDEMMANLNSFDNQYGIFNFDAYNEFLDSLKQKYGEADFQKAMEYRNQKYAEYPPLFQEYQKAKDILAPYWAIQTQVEKMFGKFFASTSRGQALIQKIRKAKRLANPEIAKAYSMFYTNPE